MMMSEMTWHSCIPYLQLCHCYQVVQYCRAVPAYRKRSHVLRCWGSDKTYTASQAAMQLLQMPVYCCTHAPDGIELARPFACGIVCALICINTLSFVLLVSLYTCYCISFGHCYIGVVTVDHGSGDHYKI